MDKIETIVNQIFHLKPFPQIGHKVLALAQDPESSIQDMAEIIHYDTALTANLLKIVNSSSQDRKQKIDSVHQACAYLGAEQIIDLVMVTSGGENIASAHKGYDLSAGELWKNSVSSALIARELIEKKKGLDVHLVFTAALLKDIGKVILSQYVGEANEKINTLVTGQGLTFKEAEKEVLGICHAELGALVAKSWHFSSEMQDIILNHHQPRNASRCGVETAIVYMADILCMMMGVGVGSDGLSYRFDRDVAEQLLLTEHDIESIMAGFPEKYRQVEALVGGV